MMNQEEHVMPKVKLNVKLQCYILVYVIIVMHISLLKELSVNNTAAADADVNNTNKTVIFKNCVPFINCISEINNTQVDIVMPIYNLIEYSDNDSKTPGSLSQYCKDRQVVNNNGVIVNFNVNNAANLFNFKTKMAGHTEDNGTKKFEIMAPLKYLSTF